MRILCAGRASKFVVSSRRFAKGIEVSSIAKIVIVKLAHNVLARTSKQCFTEGLLGGEGVLLSLEACIEALPQDRLALVI